MTEYTPEEQAEHRAKWVEALRSDRFKQGRGRLRDESSGAEEFCCLGVACELAAEAGVTRRKDAGYDTDDGWAINSILPQPVARWLGLTNPGALLVDPIVRSLHDDDWTALTNLNDDASWTFAEIADLIEAGGVQTTE